MAFVAACASTGDDLGDGRDDAFLSGKADTGGVDEGSPQAAAVLRVANEVAGPELHTGAGISTQTVNSMIAHRTGPEGPFDTLAELDATPYVGPVAFQKLLAYATSHGFIATGWRTELAWPTWTQAKPTICSVDAPAGATSLRFLIQQPESAFWTIDIRDANGTMVQRINPPFVGWTNPIAGSHATYQIYPGGQYANCKDFLGLAQAKAYQVPVDPADAFACTTKGGFTNLLATDPADGIVARAYAPSPRLFHEFLATTQCQTDELALKWTPPTDGRYTFTTFAQHSVSVRVGGCGGNEVSCAGQTSTVELHGGVPVVLGLASQAPGDGFDDLTITRAKTEVDCHDGFDDDGDGAIDCADPDCTVACTAPEVCDNGLDDDGDGKADCADTQCGGTATCSTNACPGDDLGSATAPNGTYVTLGNGSLAPSEMFYSCSTNLPWTGSRFYTWTAPSAGNYIFRVGQSPGSGIYDLAVRFLDTTCDSDVLACSHRNTAGGTAGAQLAVTAGQTVVIEVAASKEINASPTYGLEIFRL